MISTDDASPYLWLWRLGHPTLRHYVTDLGYTIDIEQDGAKFRKLAASDFVTISSPEELARIIVGTLSGDDQTLFKQQMVNQTLFSALNKDGRSMQVFGKQWPDYTHYQKSVMAEWHGLKRTASDKSIDLRDIKFHSSDYTVLVLPGGMQFTHLQVTVSVDDQQQHIKLGHGILFDDKWWLLSGLDWL